MTDAPTRIDGWKAIAAYLRRSRNTTMRWAQNNDFPLRRVTGKKGGSVWAYAHELDAWLAKDSPTPTVSPSDASDVHNVGVRYVPDARTDVKCWGGAFPALALAALLLSVMAGLIVSRVVSTPARKTQPMPADAAVAEVYLQARDDWATRTPEALGRAMSEFGEVISRDPGFAPAYTGIADAYVAAIDYTGMPRPVALAKAEAAAKAGLVIDPDNADAYRVLGYVDYWMRHDLAAARKNFHRSILIQPDSAQTHLWFGSTLSDVPDLDGALGELRIARRLDPGSKVIQMFYAWSLWLEGPGDPGLAQLEGLASEGAPNLTHLFLSEIYMSKGDVAAYLDQREQYARLLSNGNAVGYVGAESEAYRAGGEAALLDLINRQPRPAGFPPMITPADVSATLASLHGQRDRLLAILAQAHSAGEHWIAWRPDQDRFARWRGDMTVMNALDQVTSKRDR